MAAVFVVLLAFALRLHRLDAQSIWYDEGTSAALASRSLATIARNAANDIHPPLYYWALAIWRGLTGDSEAALRTLSAFAGTAVVAGVYALGRRLWGTAEGLAAALLAAGSPYLVWYSQEARMYMLAAALGVALAWLALAIGAEATAPGGRASRSRWLAYVVVGVAAIHSHYFVGASALLAANGLAALGAIRAWQRDRCAPAGFVARWLGAQAVIAALFLPWLATAWPTIRDWPALGPDLTVGFIAREAVRTFALGSRLPPHLGRWAWVTAALAAIGAFAGLRDGRRWGTLSALVIAGAPLAVMWALALVRPAWDPKFLIAAAPGFELLAGAGAVALGAWAGAAVALLSGNRAGPHRRAVAVTATSLCLLAALVPRAGVLHATYTDPAYQRDDYRGIAAAITAAAGPLDAVIVNAPTQVEVLGYYDRGRHAPVPVPIGRPVDREATLSRLDALGAQQRDLFAVLWATDESDPDGVVEGWLNTHRAKVSEGWFGNVRLARWAQARAPVAALQEGLPRIFGDGEIALVHLAAGPLRATPGDVLTFEAWWVAADPAHPPGADYAVFLHVVDRDGRIVAQRDMRPVGGTERTSTWPPIGPDALADASTPSGLARLADDGQLTRDRIAIVVPTETAPGEYRLLLGLYDPGSGARLPVDAPRDGAATTHEETIELGTVVIAAP